MATRLIELQDGLWIEVEASEEGARQIAGGLPERVQGQLENVEDLLRKAVKPVASVWGELNRDLTIEQVEIELALGFEAGGNLFIARGSGSANIRFKLTVRPRGDG